MLPAPGVLRNKSPMPTVSRTFSFTTHIVHVSVFCSCAILFFLGNVTSCVYLRFVTSCFLPYLLFFQVCQSAKRLSADVKRTAHTHKPKCPLMITISLILMTNLWTPMKCSKTASLPRYQMLLSDKNGITVCLFHCKFLLAFGTRGCEDEAKAILGAPKNDAKMFESMATA